MKTALPVPDSYQQAHSDTLAAQLRDEIRQSGPMPFSRWMERCLYAPGLGYYSAGLTKFGSDGDFITAPELGSLFARCVAQAVAADLRAVGPDARFIELGAGSGVFAVDVLQALAERDCLPADYAILETSADLRERQRQHVGQRLPAELAARVHWIDTPPTSPWQGVLFANEVIDALPATRFTLRDGEVFEECVDVDGAHFVRRDLPAQAALVTAVRHIEQSVGQRFADGYRSELIAQLDGWLQAVSGQLARGIALFIDYGYTRREYYQADRSDGTLACHFRHRTHGDALALPGLQDITTSVDFSAVADVGRAAGLDLRSYTSQAQFLIAHGLADQHQQLAADANALALYRLAGQIKRLTMPDQMGERFQVITFARGIDSERSLDDYGHDRSASL